MAALYWKVRKSELITDKGESQKNGKLEKYAQ